MNELATTEEMTAIEKAGNYIAKSGLFGVKTADQAIALMLVAKSEGRNPMEAAALIRFLDNPTNGDIDTARAKQRPQRHLHGARIGGRDDGDAVMFVIVGEEREEVVSVTDLGLEEVAPPVDHRVVLLGLEHDVRELDR